MAAIRSAVEDQREFVQAFRENAIWIIGFCSPKSGPTEYDEYCRVSTEQENQAGSYPRQITCIYADEGTSDTAKKKGWFPANDSGLRGRKDRFDFENEHIVIDKMLSKEK